MLPATMQHTSPLIARAAKLLGHWSDASEEYWYETGRSPDTGCFGSGYNHWGVQSNLNYAATMATLGYSTDDARATRCRVRALAALRHTLATHKSGTRAGTDGQKWGQTWISMLGIERAMHGLYHLEAELTADDRESLKRVLTGEADSLLTPSRRGRDGVSAGKWDYEGMNNPESNIWSGCLLHRAATMYPDHEHAPRWQEQATRFLLNGVSISSDATDRTRIEGKTVSDWHAGANFFDHFALDHHGYLNVGYMVICISNIAMLHFDLKRAGHVAPASLYHHVGELWNAVRGFVFSDGRLARIGGDSRVRYSYCQEYLLPSLLFAADVLDDSHALERASAQIALVETEVSETTGLFYGERLEWLRQNNPHYYTRLESDRACALAMLINYLPMVESTSTIEQDFEASITGTWEEPEHGAVMHRCATRLASFAWRAHGLTQGLCVPPDRSDLAEWDRNLCPVIRFLGDDGAKVHRRLESHMQTTIPGGFVTAGSVVEGVDLPVPEGSRCTDQAVTHIAFAAIPDGHTCLCLQLVVTASDRSGYVSEIKDLHYCMPNDVFNAFHRTLYHEQGVEDLSSPSQADLTLERASTWLNVDDTLGFIALHGAREIRVNRYAKRQGGRYQSQFVDEICLHSDYSVRRCEPNETLVDVGFAVLSGVRAERTRATAGGSLHSSDDRIRGVWVTGVDGKRYELWANFGSHEQTVETGEQSRRIAAGTAIVIGDTHEHR